MVGQTFLSAICLPGTPMTQESKLIITRRRLPHWRMAGSVYFVTFRLWNGDLTPEERQDVLDHVKSGHEKFYCLYAVVVMPDHVHLLLQPNDDMSLSRVDPCPLSTASRISMKSAQLSRKTVSRISSLFLK